MSVSRHYALADYLLYNITKIYIFSQFAIFLRDFFCVGASLRGRKPVAISFAPEEIPTLVSLARNDVLVITVIARALARGNLSFSNG